MSPVWITALLAEPPAADPPGRVRRDWALVVVLALAALGEGVIRRGRPAVHDHRRDGTDVHDALAPNPAAGPDVRMPILDGIEATRLLAGSDVSNPMAVVVITTFDLDDYVHGALRAGARGFLLKDAGPELLVQAIEAAASGEALIAPSVNRRLLERFAEIADELHISLSTVKSHVASLMAELGVRNRVELAMWAHETSHVPRSSGTPNDA